MALSSGRGSYLQSASIRTEAARSPPLTLARRPSSDAHSASAKGSHTCCCECPAFWAEHRRETRSRWRRLPGAGGCSSSSWVTHTSARFAAATKKRGANGTVEAGSPSVGFLPVRPLPPLAAEAAGAAKAEAIAAASREEKCGRERRAAASRLRRSCRLVCPEAKKAAATVGRSRGASLRPPGALLWSVNLRETALTSCRRACSCGPPLSEGCPAPCRCCCRGERRTAADSTAAS
mmetsp:Transcript_8193/g.23516  ORF Transcript_8193/g.23516 Transcript_8193/m.23516 type:complete len:235 (-) Transcript_8193:242-946(-)